MLLSGFMLRDLRGASKVRSLWVFCSCLLLGIALIAASGSLLQLVRSGFAQQERNLFGGDLQISQRQAITAEQRQWVSDNADISLLLELRTMMGTQAGNFSVVELQSVDDAYPLYGSVKLSPDIPVRDAVKKSPDGIWGAAFDPALVEQLSLEVGQMVSIGNLQLQLRAMVVEQPDRSLSADVRGPPVIVDEQALEESGLLLPGSLVDYDYRVRIDGDPSAWRERLQREFPDAQWEVQTVEERAEFVGQRLDQVASVLLLIGFSTLLIGGLGVANSIRAYLQTKLRTIATLQSLGAKSVQVSRVYIGQIALLALFACTAGALLGSTIAWLAATRLEQRLPLDTHPYALAIPTLLAILLGLCAAMAFTLPILSRTLNEPTVMLIKGMTSDDSTSTRGFRLATALISLLGMVLLLIFIPEPLIALGFIIGIGILFLLLDGVVAIIRRTAEKLAHVRALDGHFALRLAIAGLYRPGSSLRPMLLSLGAALTLLVAAGLIILTTYNTLNDTVPQRAPSLVFYDVQTTQLQAFDSRIAELDGYEDHTMAPLVLGRLTQVNGKQLSDSGDTRRALEANDEHKLSYRLSKIDNTRIQSGEWWPDIYYGPPLVAMEDREAGQIGLEVGDTLTFTIMGEDITARLAAIYSQARFETSFWLEAVFTPDVLDPFITRYIGSAILTSDSAIRVQSELAAKFPNVVSVRTEKILEASRSILSSAGLAMMLIGAVCLSASVLVMASVVAVNRQRQIYEASIMHAMGTRMRVVLQSVLYEYLLLAVVLSAFALIIGSTLARVTLGSWLKLEYAASPGVGLLIAGGASLTCLMGGALWLICTLRASPASLLRRGT